MNLAADPLSSWNVGASPMDSSNFDSLFASDTGIDFSPLTNADRVSTVSTPGIYNQPDFNAGSVFSQILTGGAQSLFQSLLPSAADEAAKIDAQNRSKSVDTATTIALLNAQTQSDIAKLNAQRGLVSGGAINATTVSPLLIYGGIGLLAYALIMKRRK